MATSTRAATSSVAMGPEKAKRRCRGGRIGIANLHAETPLVRQRGYGRDGPSDLDVERDSHALNERRKVNQARRERFPA